MKIVAPLVLTLGLSFILYREVGKWSPVEVWPKADYDAYVSNGGGQRQAGDFTARELLERRNFAPDWAKGQQYAGESKADHSGVHGSTFQYPQGGGGKSATNPIDISGGGSAPNR